MSVPSLVLAKSSGYTNMRDVTPAKPPDRMFDRKTSPGLVSFFGAPRSFFVRVLYLSLNAKFKACVGKYLTMLARFPLQRAAMPSSLETLTKQSAIPLY